MNKEIEEMTEMLEKEMNYAIPKWQARKIISLGYQKLTENAVVIPNKITEETSPKDIIKIAKYNEKLRKKTASELLFNFESAFACYDNEDMFSKEAIFECIEEIAKQFGVEVEDD